MMYGGQKTYSDYDRRYERQKSDRKIQAIKTAWRIIKVWVDAQMALVETNMTKTEDVFLPYLILKGGRTLSEAVNADPNFLLGDGK